MPSATDEIHGRLPDGARHGHRREVCKSVRLRCLLGSGTTSRVSGDIGSGVELPSTALDTVPNLSSSWWGSLSPELAVNPGLEGGEGVLDVRALAKASADEDGVECK